MFKHLSHRSYITNWYDIEKHDVSGMLSCSRNAPPELVKKTIDPKTGRVRVVSWFGTMCPDNIWFTHRKTKKYLDHMTWPISEGWYMTIQQPLSGLRLETRRP